MNRRIAATLVAGITAATLGLTGCGAEETGTTPSAPPSALTQPSVESSPTAADPSSAASPESTSAEPSGDSGAKPSKADIVAGLSTFYQSTQGLSAAKSKKFAVCMVDEMYAKATTATLVAMRDGDPTKIDKSDIGLVAEAGSTCQPALA